MREIQLTRGQVAVIDDIDYDRVSAHKWQAHWNKNVRSFYAVTGMFPGRKFVLMHRFIKGVTDPNVKVDHRNHDTLDMRDENLRVSSDSQSQMNRRRKINKLASRFKGVHANNSRRKPWVARITKAGKPIFLGRFSEEIEAAKAYNRAALEFHGEFALLNEV
jgi:hypothetical protein